MNRGVQIRSLADLAGGVIRDLRVGHARDSQVGQCAKGVSGQIVAQLGTTVTDINRRGKVKRLSQRMRLM